MAATIIIIAETDNYNATTDDDHQYGNESNATKAATAADYNEDAGYVDEYPDVNNGDGDGDGDENNFRSMTP